MLSSAIIFSFNFEVNLMEDSAHDGIEHYESKVQCLCEGVITSGYSDSSDALLQGNCRIQFNFVY